MPFAPSFRLAGRYTLLDRIGSGGMSEVWRARDEVLHRLVAVKTLDQALAADPRLRATIQREARAAARLTHPHVTQVYDYGEEVQRDGQVLPFLVMELVIGENLGAVLARGPLPWRHARQMAGEVAAALAAAHAIGVVHGDVKPGNIMLTAAGVKVVDFGIAALTGAPPSPAGGPVLGTPAYLAPERLSGAAPQPANDVYSLGAVLYQALTGQQSETAPLIDDPGMPVALGEICRRCLSTDPARRPTAAQVAAALGEAVTAPTRLDLPTIVAPVAPTQVWIPPRRGTRLPWIAAGAAAAVTVMALALAVVLAQDGGTPAVAPTPTPPEVTTGAPASPTGRATGGDPLDRFTAAVDQGVADGTIDEDVAEDLLEKTGDLREALTGDERGKRVGRRAAEVRKEINEAVEDGEIDDATADELRGLLDQL